MNADYAVPLLTLAVIVGLILVTIYFKLAEWMIDLGEWWKRQAQIAQTREAQRATRKMAPLVSINIGKSRAAYVEDDEGEGDTRTGTQNQAIPDTYQSEPASIAPADTSTVLPDTAALVRHLAGLRLTSGAYAMSANKIVQAVEMGRNDVLALVREVRNEPEPTHGPQFVKVGDREQYQRVGAPPLR